MVGAVTDPKDRARGRFGASAIATKEVRRAQATLTRGLRAALDATVEPPRPPRRPSRREVIRKIQDRARLERVSLIARAVEAKTMQRSAEASAVMWRGYYDGCVEDRRRLEHEARTPWLMWWRRLRRQARDDMASLGDWWRSIWEWRT